jgi:CubicO group peptidase (beta-lactamase class C family)
MKKIYSLVLLSLLLYNCTAQKTNNELDKALFNIQKKSNLPGFAIAIIKSDSVIFSKGYGFADKQNKRPYTPQTIQPIGSVSKTFIGLALMKAIESGLFTLETNINDLLPFKVINPHFPNESIKIKHLVTHTAGLLDDETGYMNSYVLGNRPTVALKYFLKDYYDVAGKNYSPNNFAKTAPGKEYSYSNIAASLTAYIIEVVTKMPFDQYTTRTIFTPLQMNKSSWFYDSSKATDYAVLYEVNKQIIPLYQSLLNKDGSVKPYSCNSYPDGSLKSSVADLTKYALAMTRGYFGTAGLLKQENFKILFEKRFNEADMPVDMDKKEPNRAVFWAYNRKGKIIHTGSDPGVAAFISIDPATKIARVILINTQLEGEENNRMVEYFKQIIVAMDSFEAALP